MAKALELKASAGRLFSKGFIQLFLVKFPSRIAIKYAFSVFLAYSGSKMKGPSSCAPNPAIPKSCCLLISFKATISLYSVTKFSKPLEIKDPISESSNVSKAFG